MSIDDEALKNFENSNFNFVDDEGKDVDYSNLSEDVKYTLRDDQTVVQDNMPLKYVVDTINNEFGEVTNV